MKDISGMDKPVSPSLLTKKGRGNEQKKHTGE
jgi:hypothetical protein